MPLPMKRFTKIHPSWRSRHNPAARRIAYRREMPRRNASLCDLPVELKVLVLSHIERVETHHILALSSTVQEAFSLLRALPRATSWDDFYFAYCLVHLLDDDRVRSLQKERAVELIGDDKDRLCEYACGRNFEVLKWAHNELDLPWAPYPAGRVSDDVLALRVIRDTVEERIDDEWWPEIVRSEEWNGVKMVDGRVVELDLSLSLTAEVPAEIGQLTSLKKLYLGYNQLTSLPAKIGQLTSLTYLHLHGNQLTSLPAEIGQLTSLVVLFLNDNELESVPVEIGQLTSLPELHLDNNQLTSLPAEIGQLAALRELYLSGNQLTSLPAEIGQLTSLEKLRLQNNKLRSVPAAIRKLRKKARCIVDLDRGVTVDK